MVDEILDLSKIESDRFIIENARVNLFSLLNEIASYFKMQAEEKNIHFSIQYHYPLPFEIITDPTRLKQILINLCGNALKFTESGSIVIYVYVDINAEKIFFSVSDTGIGVESDAKNRVFQAFEQAPQGNKSCRSSSGLGLHISKQLAQKMGGDIEVRSALGYGSTFTLCISMGDVKDGKFAVSTVTLPQAEQTIDDNFCPALEGEVLFVDDNEDNRALIKLLVEQTGANITLASSGADGVSSAKVNHYDLILMDIQMPGMDGIEATHRILADQPDANVVACTSNIMKEDLRGYDEAGFRGCVAKPINRSVLYKLLMQSLKPQVL